MYISNVYTGKTLKVRDAPLQNPIKDGCFTNLLSIVLNEAQNKVEIGTPYHLMRNGDEESKFSITFINLQRFKSQLLM